MSAYDVSGSHWVKAYELTTPHPPWKNGGHWAGEVFMHIFMNEKFCILIRILIRNSTEMCLIKNKSMLVELIALRRTGDKSLAKPMLTKFIDAYMRHLGDDLTRCGREDLWKWAIFNTILTSPKFWLSQEDLDAGCEHSSVPMDS